MLGERRGAREWKTKSGRARARCDWRQRGRRTAANRMHQGRAINSRCRRQSIAHPAAAEEAFADRRSAIPAGRCRIPVAAGGVFADSERRNPVNRPWWNRPRKRSESRSKYRLVGMTACPLIGSRLKNSLGDQIGCLQFGSRLRSRSKGLIGSRLKNSLAVIGRLRIARHLSHPMRRTAGAEGPVPKRRLNRRRKAWACLRRSV